MSKRVLLVEDNGSLSNELERKIEELDYYVERAYSNVSAFGIWREDGGEYDCIILDLQINPDGLELEEIEKYAPIFGIAFLHKICEGKTPAEVMAIHKKTIIYSGFKKELKDLSHKYEWDFGNVKIIEKKGSSIPELIKNVEKICSR